MQGKDWFTSFRLKIGRNYLIGFISFIITEVENYRKWAAGTHAGPAAFSLGSSTFLPIPYSFEHQLCV